MQPYNCRCLSRLTARCVAHQRCFDLLMLALDARLRSFQPCRVAPHPVVIAPLALPVLRQRLNGANTAASRCVTFPVRSVLCHSRRSMLRRPQSLRIICREELHDQITQPAVGDVATGSSIFALTQLAALQEVHSCHVMTPSGRFWVLQPDKICATRSAFTISTRPPSASLRGSLFVLCPRFRVRSPLHGAGARASPRPLNPSHLTFLARPGPLRFSADFEERAANASEFVTPTIRVCQKCLPTTFRFAPDCPQ